MNEYIYLRAWCRLLGSFFNFIEGKGKTEDLQATGYLVDVFAGQKAPPLSRPLPKEKTVLLFR